MNKPVKPEADDDFGAGDDALGPIQTDAKIDDWYVRNREAIIELVDEGFAEIERGEFDERSFAEIIAEGIQKNSVKR